MSPVTACLMALLTVGFLVAKRDASVLQGIQADASAVEERGTSVSDKIRQLTQNLETCANNQDVDCFLAYCDDDIRMMPIKSQTHIGKTETRKHMWWIKLDVVTTYTVKEIIPTDGSYVVEWIEISMVYPNGTTVYDGKGVNVWKKVNDDYKIYIDIVNDN